MSGEYYFPEDLSRICGRKFSLKKLKETALYNIFLMMNSMLSKHEEILMEQGTITKGNFKSLANAREIEVDGIAFLASRSLFAGLKSGSLEFFDM